MLFNFLFLFLSMFCFIFFSFLFSFSLFSQSSIDKGFIRRTLLQPNVTYIQNFFIKHLGSLPRCCDPILFMMYGYTYYNDYSKCVNATTKATTILQMKLPLTFSSTVSFVPIFTFWNISIQMNPILLLLYELFMNHKV